MKTFSLSIYSLPGTVLNALRVLTQSFTKSYELGVIIICIIKNEETKAQKIKKKSN